MWKCVCDCPHTKCGSIPRATQEERCVGREVFSAVDSPVLRRPVFERVFYLGERLAHVASDTARDDAPAFPEEPRSTARVGQVTSIQAVCRACPTNPAPGAPIGLIPWVIAHVHAFSIHSCSFGLRSEDQFLARRPFDRATYKKRRGRRQYCKQLF